MRTLIRILSVLFVFCQINSVFSQAVGGLGVNSTGSPADPSAMLDVSSQSTGVLIPRMTTLERNNIQNPAEGLFIFNTDNKCFEVFKFGGWYELCENCNPQVPVSVTISQNPVNPVCINTPISFTATGLNMGNSPLVEWFVNGVNTGDTGLIFTLNNPLGNEIINCILTSNAFCAINNPAISNNLTVSIINQVATPVAITATSIGSNQFTANWNVTTGATTYFIDVSDDINFSTFISGYNNLNVGGVTSYTISGLTPQTNYYYRVRAENSCNTSNSSNIINVTTNVYTPGKNVFVSSTTHLASLGGVNGADNICQSHANNAGLSGTFMAWISSSSSTPNSRFVKSSAPYILVNGTTIANNWTDLTDGTLQNPINVDEYGNIITSEFTVWTNTDIYGNFDTGFWGGCTSNICNNWTDGSSCNSSGGGAMAGNASATNSDWVHYSCGCCLNSWRLYCFEQ